MDGDVFGAARAHGLDVEVDAGGGLEAAQILEGVAAGFVFVGRQDGEAGGEALRIGGPVAHVVAEDCFDVCAQCVFHFHYE